MTDLKTAGMLRSDGTLGLDPVYEVDGWRTYVVYPVPRSVVESFELAMGMRIQAQARRLQSEVANVCIKEYFDEVRGRMIKEGRFS